MTNTGKWNTIYDARPYNWPYGPQISYLLALDFLSNCHPIQDWGCGANWFKTLAADKYPDLKITGVDGSGKQCDLLADLVTFQPEAKPEGILLRHVLEHNNEWELIFRNALSCTTKKLMLILFTPFSETVTKAEPDYIFDNGDTCPNLSFPQQTLLQIMREYGFEAAVQTIKSKDLPHNLENLFYATKMAPLIEDHSYYARKIDLQRSQQND